MSLSARLRLRKHSGFTLVELLVVIAIIGILIALLLPAVQAARDAARRTQCMDTLKQLGLAAQTYNNGKKSLPPGKTVVQTNCTSGVTNFSNWALELLPYVEEVSLYKSYDFTLPNSDTGSVNKQTNQNTGNLPVLQTIVKILKCPSDPNQEPLSNTGNGPFMNAGDPMIALGSYRGVAGRGYADAPGAGNQNGYFDSAQLRIQPGDMRLQDRGALPVKILPSHPGTGAAGTSCPNTGYLKSAVKMDQIKDGTSKTLLIGEWTTVSGLKRSAFWANSYYGMNLGSITLTTPYYAASPSPSMQFMAPTLDPDYDKCVTQLTGQPGVGTPGQPCNRAFAGLHGGGGYINFVLCDASVHTISANMDMTLLSNLATINGGETTSVP